MPDLTKEEFAKIKDEHKAAVKRFKIVKDRGAVNLKYYRGSQWDEAQGRQYNDQVVDNMVYKNIRTMLSTILISNPRVSATPLGRSNPDPAQASALVELVADHYIRELKLKREVRKNATDAMIWGYGVMWFGFSFETEEVETEEGENAEVNEIIKEDSPFAVRLSPRDILVSAECHDPLLLDAGWIARRWVKRLDDVKNDKEYKNTADLEPNWSKSREDKDAVRPDNVVSPAKEYGGVSGVDFVEGWDRWDKRTGFVTTYVMGHHKPLCVREWPLKFDKGFPCEILYFNENPDDFYPLSDVQLFISLQDVLNRLKSLQLDHVRRVSQRKYTSLENSMDESEERKLQLGADGTIIKVKSEAGLVPIPDNPVSQDSYMMIQSAKNDIRETAGIAAFENGTSQKYDTAAEPQAISQAVNALRDERREIISDFWVRIVRKLLMVIRQVADEEINIPVQREKGVDPVLIKKLAQITGPEGQVLLPWLSVQPGDLAGDFNFEMSMGSVQPENSGSRRADFVQPYGLFKDNPYVDPVKATAHGFKIFGVADPSELMADPAQVRKNQQAQQQKQDQMVQFQQQIEALKIEVSKMKLAEKERSALATSQEKSQTQLAVQKNKSETQITEALIDHDKEEKKAYAGLPV